MRLHFDDGTSWEVIHFRIEDGAIYLYDHREIENSHPFKVIKTWNSFEVTDRKEDNSLHYKEKVELSTRR